MDRATLILEKKIKGATEAFILYFLNAPFTYEINHTFPDETVMHLINSRDSKRYLEDVLHSSRKVDNIAFRRTVIIRDEEESMVVVLNAIRCLEEIEQLSSKTKNYAISYEEIVAKIISAKHNRLN